MVSVAQYPKGMCRNCQAPTEAQICWECIKLLRRKLSEVPWFLSRLGESAYGGAKTGRATAKVSQGERIPGPPLNERAATLLRDTLALAVWACDLAPLDRKGMNAATAARWLVNHPSEMMANPWAADALRWLTKWIEDASRAIDLPPETRYAGPCPTRHVTGPKAGELCGTALYVPQGETLAVCPQCRMPTQVEMAQDAALQRLYRQLRPAADMWRFARWLGREVPRSSFFKLMADVPPLEHDDDTPLYAWSDVEAALDERDRVLAERRWARQNGVACTTQL